MKFGIRIILKHNQSSSLQLLQGNRRYLHHHHVCLFSYDVLKWGRKHTFVERTVVVIFAASDASTLLGGLHDLNVMIVSSNKEPRLHLRMTFDDAGKHIPSTDATSGVTPTTCAAARVILTSTIIAIQPVDSLRLNTSCHYDHRRGKYTSRHGRGVISHCAHFPPLGPRSHRYSKLLQNS
jgi:hypothetical protein